MVVLVVTHGSFQTTQAGAWQKAVAVDMLQSVGLGVWQGPGVLLQTGMVIPNMTAAGARQDAITLQAKVVLVDQARVRVLMA
jgi:hypothetical protein